MTEGRANLREIITPHAREAQIFPCFDAETIARLMPYGTVEYPKQGTILFERGDRSADFFVVLDGAIELLDQSHPEEPFVFRCYDGGQFTGELHLFRTGHCLSRDAHLQARGF